MKKILTVCVLFAGTCLAQAYELVATVSVWDESQCHIDIELADNDVGFTAFQMNITLDGDAKLKRDSITSGPLMRDHNLKLNVQNGYYRVMGYNMENRIMHGKEGSLFSFTVVGDLKGISIGGITFVKTNGTGVEPNDCAKDKDADKENEVVYNMQDVQAFPIDRRGISIRRGK